MKLVNGFRPDAMVIPVRYTMDFSARRQRGFTSIELVVVMAIAGVVLALVLAALQATRETARRAKCADYLKQLALAAANYESVNGTLPSNGFSWAPDNCPDMLGRGFSAFAHMFGQLERQSVYDAINFSLTWQNRANMTVAGLGINSLWCPSDAMASLGTRSRYFNGKSQYLSSYGCNEGLWEVVAYLDPDCYALPGRGLTPDQATVDRLNTFGTVFPNSALPISSITDGVGNTVIFGERAVMLLETPVHYNWQSNGSYDTYITGFRRPNSSMYKDRYIYQNASSFHPGGVNLAFVDGSVRFIGDSVACWPVDAKGYPAGIKLRDTKGGGKGFSMRKGKPQVYQALFTRANHEPLPADSY